jgi:hypothetical protein
MVAVNNGNLFSTKVLMQKKHMYVLLLHEGPIHNRYQSWMVLNDKPWAFVRMDGSLLYTCNLILA